jgi:hypothetical protein
MQRVLKMALATAALMIAVPANASVTLGPTNGNLSTKITADQGDNNLHDVVYGTDGLVAEDVSYDGNVNISITGGNGFAEIDPGNGVTNFTTLLIDPTNDFTQYEFAIALVADGSVTVYTAFAGADVTNLANFTACATCTFSQGNNANTNYLINSTTALGAIRIVSNQGISFVKQNSITLAAPVPEPATWALMLLGFGGMGMALRRTRRRKMLMQIA